MKTDPRNLIIVALTAALISGLFACQSLSIPSLSQFWTNADKLKTAYCSEIMLEARERILVKLRAHYPDYPVHGFCGVIEDLSGLNTDKS